MSGSGAVFTIPPGVPFVDALAAGLIAETSGDPLALADHVVLLPTRRACRALREAFLRASDGRPLLLPRMQPLGDVDLEEIGLGEAPGIDDLDLPPAIPELRRLMLLARLIRKWEETAPLIEGEAVSVDHAVRLAQELAGLLDQVQTERLSFDALDALVPREHALHWERTLSFLRIVTAHWPAILADAGLMDPADRRNRLLATAAEAWEAAPPAGAVIAAGSTGSVPATADLLAAIAKLPRGRIVLPGLDRDIDSASWDAIRQEQTHPQHGMARLLDRLGVDRTAVRGWAPEAAPGVSTARAALVSEALRPSGTTDAWRVTDRVAPVALQRLLRIDCPGDKEEAETIALLLRHALETPGRRAALVTPDRRLARRVTAGLARWGIEIDDSAGRPLRHTAPGAFLCLLAETAAQGLSPVSLLAFCKHPLAACGMPAAAFRQGVRRLERWLLRGPKPAEGIEGLRAALAESTAEGGLSDRLADDLRGLIDALGDGLAPLTAAMRSRHAPLRTLVQALVDAAETCAASDTDTGPSRLWHGEAGEALALFVGELAEAASDMEPVPPASLSDLLDATMGGRVVRPRYGRHPRLHIWGPLEARLQQADLIILGGLNEGVWPAEPAPDPWLSRPMRAGFGLPLPERRIGLAAHDFAQLFCAPELVVTRAEKSEGTPTVPSRWLLRIEAVLRAAGLEFPSDPAWLGRQRGLIHVEAHRPIAPPRPCPPVSARPRRLSVTRVETWIRDPYSIFAREILKLEALDPLAADPGAAERGTFIHEALHRFVRAFPGALPEDAFDRMIAIGRECFGDHLARPAVRGFWWPRFERIANWFAAVEAERRRRVLATATEVNGAVETSGPAGGFTLTGRADRIDRLRDGGLAIIDYKTGRVPSNKEIEAGFAPQLPLEAAMAARGGFAGVPAGDVVELSHWRLTGGGAGGEEKPVGGSPSALADDAWNRLQALIAAFDDPGTAYLAIPRPAKAPGFNDYAHLARILEWSGGAGGGDGS